VVESLIETVDRADSGRPDVYLPSR
jgi:hypothetical protein